MHARSRARGNEALLAAPGAAGVLVGDLSSLRQTRELADSVNAQGRFDAVIHNAGVGYREPRTDDRGWAGARVCDQCSSALPADRVGRVPLLADLLELGVTERPGDPEFRRFAMGAPTLEQRAGLRRLQAAGRGPCVHRRRTMAGGIRQRGGARLGGDENGRSRSARRHGERSADPGVAGRSTGRPPMSPAATSTIADRGVRPRSLRTAEVHQLLLESCSSLTGVELPA